jgi:hypothetical protein
MFCFKYEVLGQFLHFDLKLLFFRLGLKKTKIALNVEQGRWSQMNLLRAQEGHLEVVKTLLGLEGASSQ